jgi:hypothetical protein
MKGIIYFIISILFVIMSQASAQTVEIHEFGAVNIQYYIYSDGKAFEFIAQNSITIDTVEVKSVLASNIPATFHIEISIRDSVIARWDHFVNRISNYLPYYHTEQVSFSQQQGDTIVYKIYGNSFWSPEGGLSGISYVKLMGSPATNIEIVTTPSIIILSQNYPNPFNSYTTINFQVAKSAPVILKIYDITGREVRTLIDTFFGVGNFSITWDGLDNNDRRANAGVYFYSLQSGDFKEVKKALLLE